MAPLGTGSRLVWYSEGRGTARWRPGMDELGSLTLEHVHQFRWGDPEARSSENLVAGFGCPPRAIVRKAVAASSLLRRRILWCQWDRSVPCRRS